MKKSILFLINGLGIEKQGSYSIAIDQSMPNLARLKETSFFTTAIINSLEPRGAYESFFLGDTYRGEINFINENVLNDNVVDHPTFQGLSYALNNEAKFHIFLEPNNEKIVDEINLFVNKLNLGDKREVYLHLLLNQQTVSDYNKLIDIVKYIKFHIASCITVGFIIGKEIFHDEMSTEEIKSIQKMLFFASCERWTETDKKLISLKEGNIRPCVAPGFCATNSCTIANGDVVMFFNTRRNNYDNLINIIYSNAKEIFKTEDIVLPLYSLIKLDSSYNIPFFCENINYNNSLKSLIDTSGKKTLIITDEKNMTTVNFIANNFNHINNPNINFMKIDYNYLSSSNNISNLIDNTFYDLIIFDFHMDVSKTVNDLKNQLTYIDAVLGLIAPICENKHSLFITSLYGLKKELPLADYNPERVLLDYEMQIPIFFYDYTYPRSKFNLYPGDTHDILTSAMRCVWDNNNLYTLVRPRGIINGLLGGLKKN